jgi:hypothetical protein
VPEADRPTVALGVSKAAVVSVTLAAKDEDADALSDALALSETLTSMVCVSDGVAKKSLARMTLACGASHKSAPPLTTLLPGRSAWGKLTDIAGYP